ncbi:LuxR family transcriptional regulator [Microbacterium schleiferi]|uniref:LuxR family transcriptional regulator n=1 Tax=Microbacterium schleiferi TaxID=69362 RepID=A0ABU7V4S8_9MICO
MSSATPHPGSWPVVGRDTDAESLVSALGKLPVRAQILTGPPGIGKTALAGLVAERMPERAAVSIIGLSELAAVPLAAFSPALTVLGLPVDPAEAVPALISRIGRNPGDFIFVVDDAPRLDDVSAAVVYQLARGFGVPMIATARLGETLPAPLAKLVLEGFAEERRVRGLAVDDVQELLHHRFGAVGRRADASRLAGRTDGNPLYLRMLVEAAHREGAVRVSDGVVEIEDGATPPDLLQTVDAAIAALNEDDRAALRFASVTQPLDLDSLDRSSPWPRRMFDALLARGLLVRDAGTRSVRVAHPLLSEGLDLLGDDAAPARTYAIAHLRSLADPTSRFKAIVLQSESAAVDAVDLVWAADHAFRSADFEHAAAFAQRATGAASVPAQRFRAYLVLACARSSLGDLDAADAAFDAAIALTETGSTRAGSSTSGSGEVAEASEDEIPWRDRALLASRRGEHLAFRRFDVAAAIQAAEDLQASAPPTVGATLEPELRLWRGLVGQMHERTSETEADESPEMLVRGAVASIMTESMNGRTAAAVEAASLLSDAQARFGVLDPFAAAMIGFETYFGFLSRGEHERAVEFAEQRRATAGEGAGIWTSTVAEHRSYNGRLSEARRLSALAVDQLRWRDPFAIMPLAPAIRADLTAKSGDLVGARDLLNAMDPAQRSEPKALLMAAECEAWLAHAAGDSARAAALIEAAAEQAMGVGFQLVAAISLGVCIRVGKVDRAAAMLEAICEQVPAEMRLFTALRDVAVALRDRTPGRMPTAASALVAGGMAPTALDAIELARRMRQDAETRHRLDRVALMAADGVDAPLLQRRDSPVISQREREVAIAAASRARSREIAERFGVSSRTIDNQLQSVYRKLGVSSRDELRAALHETGLLARSAD